MASDLERAAAEYAAAQRAVTEALDAVAEARAEVGPARARLAAAIVRAAEAGVRQRDIVDVTGYSREHVRRILRDAGVE